MTARFKRAVPCPARFLVAFPRGVVPANGYFFTVFLALQNRGSFRANNNQAEYAELVRESLATTTQWTYLTYF